MPLILTEKTGINLAVDGGNLDVSADAADILTLIKTVDGAASGLDADLLDGQQGTAYATAAQGALADTALQGETGTWTPVITGSSGNPTYTTVSAAGYYTKVEKLVHYRLGIAWSGLSGGSGELRVSIPLAALALVGSLSVADYGGNAQLSSIGFPVGTTMVSPNVIGGQSYFVMVASGDNVSYETLTVAELNASGIISVRGTYRVD